MYLWKYDKTWQDTIIIHLHSETYPCPMKAVMCASVNFNPIFKPAKPVLLPLISRSYNKHRYKKRSFYYASENRTEIMILTNYITALKMFKFDSETSPTIAACFLKYSLLFNSKRIWTTSRHLFQLNEVWHQPTCGQFTKSLSCLGNQSALIVYQYHNHWRKQTSSRFVYFLPQQRMGPTLWL